MAGLLAHELRTVLRRERTALVLAASLLAATSAVLGGRRLAQGVLSGADAVAVVVDAMAATLPALALVATGRRVASRRSQGVELAAYLSGVDVSRQGLAAAADAIVLAVGAVLSVFVAVLAAGAGLRQLTSHAALSAAVGAVAVVLVTAVWATALALFADSLPAFVLLAALTVLVGVALSWFGVIYPALLQVAAAWPTQAVTAFLIRRTDQNYATQLVALGIWTVVAAVVVRTAVPRAVIGQRGGHNETSGTLTTDGPDGRVPGPADRPDAAYAGRDVARRSRRAARTAVVAGVALGWGLVGPAALAPYVPWRLQPWWRDQVRRDVASYDVGRQFVAAVQRGDVDAAAPLATDAPSRVVGPLQAQLAALDPASARVDAVVAQPGVVVLDDGAGRRQLWLCLTGGRERPQGWQVQAVRTRADCPAEPK